MAGGRAWQGHVWQRGACIGVGSCMAGDMHRGVCMAGACVCRGACMVGDMHGGGGGRRPLQLMVRILLECILVSANFRVSAHSALPPAAHPPIYPPQFRFVSVSQITILHPHRYTEAEVKVREVNCINSPLGFLYP